MNELLATYIPYIPHLSAIGVLLIILWYAHKNSAHSFNGFDYLVDENGKASKTGLGQMFAIFTGTWVIVNLTVDGKLTEGIFGLYLAAMGMMAGFSKWTTAKKTKKTDEPE